ncbi:ribonuclease D [Candidatus Tisiphia endosymbiont of Nemotelus uliginosus]|uniref:ribonuclease D n=1 Tax=Candidatus Tisiphia endosymbiont of Nemotelus uliginosus TaxID=3077926 RepID=UPI0035C8A0C0
MLIIDNQNGLNNFCEQLLQYKVIGVDTEFVRERTYFAQLSIIQVITSDHKMIIDNLSKIDLSPLNEIFLNDQILKIFHAPREDFEIFYRLFKKLPKNIFDIQIAAGLSNFGKYLSYADICSKICGIQVDKTYQRSNWLKRPINADMLDYAIKDVEYLEPIYQILQPIIANNNLQQDYNAQIKSLLNIENYIVNPSNAWKKVRFDNYSSTFIDKMKIMAGYREEGASKIDVPRRHFITDEDLVKICQYLPISDKDFKNLRLESNYLNNKIYRTEVGNLCVGLREVREKNNFYA